MPLIPTNANRIEVSSVNKSKTTRGLGLGSGKAVGGFTLTELLIAAAITSIVLTMAGAGLITLLSSNQAAERRQDRRQELNRALSFIADDIRAAQRINKKQDNSPVSARDALNDAASHFPAEVPYASGISSERVLYLEIPMEMPTSGTCPDGSTPPNVDRVAYELRPARNRFLNTTPTLDEKLWQGPSLLYRHGRMPDLGGRIDPCSSPVSRVLVDGLLNADTSAAPSCGTTLITPRPAILSGIGGFYTCVSGGQVALMLRGDGSPQRWASRGGRPLAADIVPVTLSSIVFQRGGDLRASAPPATLCVVPDVPVTVPNLLGLKQDDAKGIVTKADLIHNAVVDPDLTTTSQVVISQIPAAGTKLPCNQIVTFTYAP